MKGFEKWATRLALLLVGGTGVAYGLLKYFFRVTGEFGEEPHPAQSTWQHLHVLLAPLVVFFLGTAMRGHGWSMWKQPAGREGRGSGLWLALIGVPMVFAGYGIQIVTGTLSRTTLAWVHGVTSALFLGLYAAHGLGLFRGLSTRTFSKPPQIAQL